MYMCARCSCFSFLFDLDKEEYLHAKKNVIMCQCTCDIVITGNVDTCNKHDATLNHSKIELSLFFFVNTKYMYLRYHQNICISAIIRLQFRNEIFKK